MVAINVPLCNQTFITENIFLEKAYGCLVLNHIATSQYRVKFDHRKNMRFSTFHHHPTHMRRMYFAFCLYLRCVSLINKMFYLWTCCKNKQAEREFIGEGDLMLKQINSIKALFKLTHIKWMNEFVDI